MSTSFATINDLQRMSINANALSSMSEQDKTAALASASTEAEGYLAAQFKMPLIAWGDDLRQKVCDIAAFRLLKKRGMMPGGGGGAEYELTRQGYEDAISWLKSISRGQVIPSNIQDNSLDIFEGGIGISSDDARGW